MLPSRTLFMVDSLPLQISITFPLQKMQQKLKYLKKPDSLNRTVIITGLVLLNVLQQQLLPYHNKLESLPLPFTFTLV
jgi:hypothetical protein